MEKGNNIVGRVALCLLACLVQMGLLAQTTQWQDVYKAKKKDTVYGIAKRYGLTTEELEAANPDMKKEGYQLKKGDFVFIPHPSQKATGATTSVAKPQGIVQRSISVGVMLPLHDVDGDGRRMVEYYRGMLLALDDLKRQGIATEVHAWNVPIDADIRQTLLDDAAHGCDIVFGPLYTKQVKPLGDFCKAYDIKLVIPFSINSEEVRTNDHIYQVYQDGGIQTEKAVAAFMERFPQCHAVFVDCNDANSKKGAFTMELRKQLEAAGRSYNITNLQSTDADFAKAFQSGKTNVVVLNTGRSPELNAAFAKLDIMKKARPDVAVSMVGYTEWLMYTRVYTAYYHRYDAYIPTVAYYNSVSAGTQQVESAYKTWFKSDMQAALPRFALTGYDQTMFFVRGLYERGKSFAGAKGESTYKPLQTPLKFKPIAGGGQQNESFMLVHYTPAQSIEAIQY